MGALDCVSNNRIHPTLSTEVFTVNTSSNTTLNETRRDVESQAARGGAALRHSIWWKLLLDLPLFLIVIVFIGLYELGVLPGYKAGFFCNDPALSFQFNGDTVSNGVLVSGFLLMPLVVILVTELIFADEDYWHEKFKVASKITLTLYRNYLYGVLFNFAVVEVMKAVTGSPRPTFFDLCEPDTAKTCNGTEYVTSFTCTSTKFSAWTQRDSYHSFPSGHTSTSVHCGLFVAWYLQIRAFDWRHRTVFVVPMVQLLALSFSVTSSLTRITDHRHHWYDVLVGTVVGVASAFYAVVVLSKRFRPAQDDARLPVKRLLYTNEPVSP